MHRHLKAGFAAACLFASTVACADDGDVDVFGPTTRSSIALFDQPHSFRASEVDSRTGALIGGARAHGNAIELAGVWAVDPRFNITASLTGNLANRSTVDLGNASQSRAETGTGESVGVSGWLVANAHGDGFALAGSAGVERSLEQPNRWYVQLQPQWRASDSVVATTVFGLRDAFTSGGGAVETAGAYLAWRVAPQVSVVPSVGVERFSARNTYSSSADLWAGLSTTWHVDAHWAVSLEGTWSRQTDSNTAFYLNDVHAGRGLSGELGARWTF